VRNSDPYVSETWDLTIPPLPRRSRLACLEPRGHGTAYVESLTGYVSRLAYSHAVTAAALFGWELAPLVGKTFLKRAASSKDLRSTLLASAISQSSWMLNGTGSTAMDWVRAVEGLTLCSSLSALSMLRWRNVISPLHLFRHTHAWCPACYCNQRKDDDELYDQLLWTIKTVTVCPLHKIALAELCPHCGRKPHHLSSKSRPGHCSICGGGLGDSSRETSAALAPVSESLEQALWIAQEVGELLIASSKSLSPPSSANMVRSFETCVERLAGGRMAELSRCLRISKGNVQRWTSGEGLPTLGMLIRVCRELNLPLVNFVSGNVLIERTVVENTGRALPPIAQKGARRWRRVEIEEARRVLIASLRKYPAPSLAEVASTLARDANTLRYRFPKECCQIVRRYLARINVRGRKDFGLARRALLTALRNRVTPSVEEIARKLKMSGSTLRSRHASLCRELSVKHAEYRKQKWHQVEATLRLVIECEQPPTSMRELAGRLGIHLNTLNERFPDLCHQISERAAAGRKARALRRKDELRDKVRRAAMEVYRQGRYPSVERVQWRLDVSVRSSPVALDALRELRGELGLLDVYPSTCFHTKEGSNANAA
jgi:transcriptional regulator with XRE-family HTH domain